MKEKQMHMMDLTKIKGKGDFPCPQCGTNISPDDFSDEEYSMLEIRVNQGNIDELVIRCNKCATDIHLTGFSLLQKLSKTWRKS
jgi:predicted RNA-binding Zn-ribbon protein involved in translation (DUF1610 family)